MSDPLIENTSWLSSTPWLEMLASITISLKRIADQKDQAATIERLTAALAMLLADADDLENAANWDAHREQARAALSPSAGDKP